MTGLSSDDVDLMPLAGKRQRDALLMAVPIVVVMGLAIVIDPNREIADVDGNWMIERDGVIPRPRANEPLHIRSSVAAVDVENILGKSCGFLTRMQP